MKHRFTPLRIVALGSSILLVGAYVSYRAVGNPFRAADPVLQPPEEQEPVLLPGSKSERVVRPPQQTEKPRPVMSGSKSMVIADPSDVKTPLLSNLHRTRPSERRAMALYGFALSCGLSLIFLFLVFRPLEAAFPANPGQPVFRRAWLTDLCFFLGQYLLWSGLVLWILTRFGGWLDGIVPATFRAAVAAQPWWTQAIEVVLLSDFCVYWGHRLQHASPLLWRFHSIHHSAEHLDWLAAHREHPIDTVYTMGLINLPAFILGFPLQTIAGLIAFRGVWAIYIHSNVRLPIGPLRMLIGAPELHHWHHDRDRRAGNYANISPLMDLLFGTYRCPDHEPESFGLDQPIARGYLGQMLHPFRFHLRRGGVRYPAQAAPTPATAHAPQHRSALSRS